MSFQHHLLCSGRFPGGRGGPGGLWEIVSTLSALGRDGQGGGTRDCQGRGPGWGPGNSRPRGKPKGDAVFSFMIFYDLVKQVGTTFVLLFFCALLEGKIVVSSSSCCVSAPTIVPGM